MAPKQHNLLSLFLVAKDGKNLLNTQNILIAEQREIKLELAWKYFSDVWCSEYWMVPLEEKESLMVLLNRA